MWPNAVALPQRDAHGVIVSQSAVLKFTHARDLCRWKEAKGSVIVMKLQSAMYHTLGPPKSPVP
jgi:hypothetical protein